MQFLNEFISNIMINKWHKANGVYSLSHYLKMTRREYNAFILDNEFSKGWIFRLWKYKK